MVFASPLFLFAFLPFALALYYVAPRRVRNFALLCLSLAFYAWGERGWTVVMLASIAFNWVAALVLDAWQSESRQARTRLLAAIIGVNIAALATFKYADFAVANLNVMLDALGFRALPPPKLHLPLGISFFTFHAISYVVDVFRKQSKALANPLDTALYIVLFPQLIAGPIIRYHYIEEQLRTRSPTLTEVAYGVERFMTGLAKKVLIANVAARCADAVFALQPAQLGFGNAWAGVLAYAVQIYFDFSGYSDMAVGLGSMFGFRFPENFAHPYASRSVTEFWRRWHISLSSWFRDYVYIPLGGNRVGPWRTYANLAAVFLLCGLWHGASWNFVIWGALHGAFLIVERSSLGRLVEAAPFAVRHLYTLGVVCVAWVFFRAPDLTSAGHVLAAMSGARGASPASHPVWLFVSPAVAWALPIGALLSLPVVPWLEERAAGGGLTRMWRGMLVPVSVCLFVLSTSYLAKDAYNPFIYFRF